MSQMGLNAGDIAALIEAIGRDFPRIKPSIDPAWTRRPPVRVVDCVLSLNRRYYAFVVPRLNAFESEYPNIHSFSDLRRLIDSFASPAVFMTQVLKYRDPRRALTLSGVVDYVRQIVSGDGECDELVAMEKWARSVTPHDYVNPGVRGFGLAGFQYLRMLFGANTTKPDVHIQASVAAVICRPVSGVKALMLLESASLEMAVSLRDLDTTVWEHRAMDGRRCTRR